MNKCSSRDWLDFPAVPFPMIVFPGGILRLFLANTVDIWFPVFAFDQIHISRGLRENVSSVLKNCANLFRNFIHRKMFFVRQKSKAYKELLVSCTNGNGFIGQTRHPPVFRTFWRRKFETLRVLIPLTGEASPVEAAMHLKSLSGVPETYFTSFSKWNADAEKREIAY